MFVIFLNIILLLILNIWGKLRNVEALSSLCRIPIPLIAKSFVKYYPYSSKQSFYQCDQIGQPYSLYQQTASLDTWVFGWLWMSGFMVSFICICIDQFDLMIASLSTASLVITYFWTKLFCQFVYRECLQNEIS